MNEKPVVKNVIARCGCDRILPCVAVYILYIILHGHLSPGGGFQGGVLMVALVALVYLGHGYGVFSASRSARTSPKMSSTPTARSAICTAPAPSSG